jgi:hypothetical protein
LSKSKPISKDKIDAFEYGTMNPQKKHMSKKEQEELRKRQEEEAEAEVLRDYLASFQETGKAVKTFIKGSTINPATKGSAIGMGKWIFWTTTDFNESSVW